MKALMGTAATVVILTCGYFVYDDRQAKAEEAERAQRQAEQAAYLLCRTSLQEIRDTLNRTNLWEGRTHSQRLADIARSDHPAIKKYSSVISLMYEVRWEECGPI